MNSLKTQTLNTQTSKNIDDKNTNVVYISQIKVVNGDYYVLLSDGKMLGGIINLSLSACPKLMKLEIHPMVN